MTLSPPARSLPPPAPPKVAAQTRIKALSADLEQVSAPTARAALQFEIAALTETQLSDRARALALYQEAALTDPGFRPPLFAMLRLSREDGEASRMSSVLRALVHASTTATDAASSLVELGALLEDEQHDLSGAQQSFSEALERDPTSRIAALALERMQRARGEEAEAVTTLRRRAAQVQDPALATTLAWEIADHEAATGAVDDAIATLLAAATSPARRYSTLERVAALAHTHARHSVAAQAWDDMSDLLGRHLADETFDGKHEIEARFAHRDACCTALAWQQREVGRLSLLLGADLERAHRAYQRAREHAPDDVLLALEHMRVCELRGDVDSARALGDALLPLADPLRAAALCFHLAELAQSHGDRAEAKARLQAALATDPESPAAIAVLEDALVDEGAFHTLLAHLEARAAHASGHDKTSLMERAAAIAAGPARQPTLAMRLYRALLELAPDARPIARELYGVALRTGDHAAVLASTQRLLELGVEDAEASVLLWQRYQALLDTSDSGGARALLEHSLVDPRCERWAPHVTAVAAALQRDHDLLQRAHARLAELDADPERAAAHLCARARVLLRLGRAPAAIEALQRSLQRSPGHAYAVAVLEELLHAHGDSADAVHLLREAATAAVDARRGELALLHAGAMAEAAGTLDLAARSYEEAADRDPDALSPLWALRRLSERSSDRQLELAALEGLRARESRRGPATTENLELAAAYDLVGQPALGAEPAHAALDGDDTRMAAADVMLLTETEVDAELRFVAQDTLQGYVGDETRVHLLRERAARVAIDDDAGARTAVASLIEARAISPAESLASFLSSREAVDRGVALRAFAKELDDPSARAELLLHASRMDLRATTNTGADALVEALDSYDEAPSVLSAVVALGEALSSSDDADLRVRALEGRLQHTSPEASRSLSLALGRALVEAGRAHDARDLITKLLEKDATDPCAWETLRVAARQTDDAPMVVRACDALAACCEGELRALLLEEAAAVLEEQLGRPDEAEARLRAALVADDARVSAFERLHDLMLDRGDFEGLHVLLSARLRVTASSEERSDLLYEQARLLRGLGHRDAALACLEELLGLVPLHAGALGLAAETHASQRNWSSAVEALRGLGHAAAPDHQRRLARKGAADFLERHLHDVQAAYGELKLLGKDGLADLGTWKRMADLAQRAGLLPQAVEALSQAAKLSTGQSRAALERRAAELLARDPASAEAARQAWKRALAAWPSDIDACDALCAVSSPAERSGLLTTFTAHLLSTLGKDPDNAPDLRALRRAALLAADTTIEHVTLCALSALGLASPEELASKARLDASSCAEPNETWTEEHFAALGDPNIPEAAWRFARIACKTWLDAQKDMPSQYGVTRGDRIGKGAEHAVRTALSAWTTSFGLEVGELYVGGSEALGLQMVMQAGHAQPWVVGKEVGAPLDKRARFDIARQCAATHMGVLPLLRKDKATGRDILLATWFAAVPSSTPDAERLRPLSQQLARELSRAQRRDIEECIAGLPDPQRGLEAVLDGARTLCLRAGMVAAGDPSIAIGAVLGTRVDASTLSISPQALGLLRFWTSNTLLSLRRELGLLA